MTARVRLRIAAAVMLLSALYGVLVAASPEVASAVSSGFVAMVLTAIILVNVWRKGMSNDPVKDDLERMPEGVTKDRRKHGYTKLEDLVDTEFSFIRSKLTKFFVVFGISAALALVAGYLLFDGQNNISDDIQDQRYNSLITLCESQNLRHDNAIKKINANPLAPPEIKEQLRILVDELQPKVNDCTIDAKRRVKRD